MAGKKKSLELKKHVGAIHSSNALTLLQRKIANALLYNAYDDLLTKEEHEITIGTLCKIIGYSSNDHKTIKRALVNLLSTVIEWNLIDGDKIETAGVWNASSIISDASIDKSVCTYSYSNKMKKLLYRPELYGRLNMAIQAKFQSNYGLALYENCIRYQDIGQTPWFEIDKFRKLMGVPIDKYAIFRDFKRRVLDAAVDEVNKYSQIKVEPQFKKLARQVVAIQFLIQATTTHHEPMLPLADGIHDNIGQVLKIRFGLSKKQIEETIVQYEEGYIKEKIRIIESSTPFMSGKIKSLAKYLLCALRDDYQSNKTSVNTTTKTNSEPKIHPLELNQIVEQKQRDQEKQVFDYFYGLPKKQQQVILKKFEASLRGLYRDIYYKDGLSHYQIQRELYNFLRFNVVESV